MVKVGSSAVAGSWKIIDTSEPRMPRSSPFGGDLQPAQRPSWNYRVALRLRPYATFETPPRHVYNESDINPSLTHWTSTSVPWNADTDAV